MIKPLTIVGGGPVGLIFALLNKNIDVLVLESKSKKESEKDTRALALSNSSRFVLERIGVWDSLEPKITDIKSIHTSQKGTFGRTLMKAKEYNQEALGYIVAYGDLIKSLQDVINSIKKIKVLHNTKANQFLKKKDKATLLFDNNGNEQSVELNLLILADGGNAKIRGLDIRRKTKSFNHSAIVTQVTSEVHHSNIAYERFTSMGPIALLPNLNNRFSLVWTGPTDEIVKLNKKNDKDFLIDLHEYFGDRVGKFTSCGNRITFPLNQSYIEQNLNKNIAVIGNSAQTMHPVAGQGLNTGIKDALVLSDCIYANDEVVQIELLLKKYNQLRYSETKALLNLTEFLVNFFSNNFIGLHKFRGIALTFLDLSPPIKKSFVRKMSFGK